MTLLQVVKLHDGAMMTSRAVAMPACPRLAWWREARFGLFIHYSLSAIPAGMWKGRDIGTYSEWLMNQAQVPVSEYMPLAQQFTAAGFDAEAIVRLAEEAGMRYVVMVAKHHDGFCLFDTACTDFNAVRGAPARRDLVREMADACARRGLPFGVYYSHAQDWVHRGGNGNTWDPSQHGDYDAYLDQVAVPQVRELLTNYPSVRILWYDTPRFITPERAARFQAAHRLQPELIVNDRLESRDFTAETGSGDVITPEQFVPATGYPGKDWETCMTMNRSWAFKATDHDWKSADTLLRHLSDITSKGGNFLLNIGPAADGTVPAPSVETLRAIGAWMEVHHEAIRGTLGSPFPKRLPWGRVTRRAILGGTRLYLHVWEWPADGVVVLPGLRSVLVAACLLTDGRAVRAQATEAGVVVTLPTSAPVGPIPVVVLDLAGEPVLDPPGPTTDAQGRVVLLPADAELAGPDDAKPVVVGFGEQAVITQLRDGGWRVRFHAELPRAGIWAVALEVGTAAFNRLRVTVGGDQGTASVRSVWATEKDAETLIERELGVFRLGAGTHSIEVRAELTDVRPLRLGRLLVVPVG